MRLARTIGFWVYVVFAHVILWAPATQMEGRDEWFRDTRRAFRL